MRAPRLCLASLLALVLFLLSAAPAAAQQSDFYKAVAAYKHCSAATATVTKTAHKDAVKQDVVTKGTLKMAKPASVTISTNGGSDQLIMQGSQFTMVVKGKKHTTSSQSHPQFASFQTVFESILSGGAVDISKLADLTIGKQGTLLVLTITPQAESKKAARRMLFTSFVLTIDTRTSALRSLRMNERTGYTEYAFTNFATTGK